MGYFKVKSKVNLSQMNIGDRIEESDFSSITPDGSFIQLEYVEEDKPVEPYKIKPGIFSINKTLTGLVTQKTEFVQDNILDTFVYTKDITDKIDSFFRNLHVYKEHGIEVPTRKMLVYGPAGTGKTTNINKACSNYIADERTTVLIWPTDQIEAYDVKQFFKSFKYVGVDKIILISEDLGGLEMEQAKMKSDSGLLSLLDNKEKAFKIPTLVLATTNFPEMFLGNLTNRPERFDDKIKVPFPDKQYRRELLKFFSKKEVSEEAFKLIEDNKTNDFSPAHIKECVIRSAIYEKELINVINDMIKEIEEYKKAFQDKKSLGITNDW